MLTIHNYFQSIKTIQPNTLPEKLRKGFEFVRELTEGHKNWVMYHKSTEIQKKVDGYFAALDSYLKSQPKESSQNRTAHEKPKKATSVKQPKKTEKAKTDPVPPKSQPVRVNYEHSKPVERLSDEIKFIKRYLSLHSRVKTKSQILHFINALQRAILEKRVRKTSPYADEVMQMQKQLLSAYKVMKSEHRFELGASTLKRCMEIVGSSRIRSSTQLLKRFISIQGRYFTKDKAKTLLESIDRALKASKITPTDPYTEQIKRVINSLNSFIKNGKVKDTLEIHPEALNGLNSALGCTDTCGCGKKTSKRSVNGSGAIDETPQVMSVDQVKSQKYNTVSLSAKWKALIGDICLPTHFFVYGSGGSGKTSFTLLFTQHLADLGYKILYVAGEQFNTPPFTKLLNELNIAAGKHYQIVGKLDTLNPADFDFVILDTKDSLDIDTGEFFALKSRYPDQSFIIVSHGIKGGDFKGKEQWRNIVDVMIQGEHGVIRTGHDKNRWGGAGEMLIFDHPTQYMMKD